MIKISLVEHWSQQGATHLIHDSRCARSGCVFVTLSADRDTVINYAKKVIYYGHRGDIVLDHVEPHPNHTQFTVNIAEHEATLSNPLIGRFIIDNFFAVISVLHYLKVSASEIEQIISRLIAPKGRLVRIALPGKATVIIDFAHSPDAMDKILALLNPLCLGKLWVVFGCGGDRDRGKRPLMTASAIQHADHVFVTEDNPRTEPSPYFERYGSSNHEDNPKIRVILSRALSKRHFLMPPSKTGSYCWAKDTRPIK